MKVADLCTHQAVGIGRGASLLEAAEVLSRHDVGALPVVSDDGGLLGIVTERDILHRIASGTDLEKVHVSEAQSRDPICVDEDDYVSRAARKMCDAHARHLPVVRGGKLCGMISSRDLMRALTSGVVSWQRAPAP